MISLQLEVKRLEIETMFSNLQATNDWCKNFDHYEKLAAAIWEYNALTNWETCPSHSLFTTHSEHLQDFLKRKDEFYDLITLLDDENNLLDDSAYEQKIAAATVAPSVQPKAENAPANAAPGQLRLHPLLVKAPSNFQASARARKLHFIPLPHGSGQPAGQLFCHF